MTDAPERIWLHNREARNFDLSPEKWAVPPPPEGLAGYIRADAVQAMIDAAVSKALNDVRMWIEQGKEKHIPGDDTGATEVVSYNEGDIDAELARLASTIRGNK